jgi:spheroidene monooxygenase
MTFLIRNLSDTIFMISMIDQVATMTFFRFEGFNNRRWAMKQMYESRAKLRKNSGIEFFKILGTGGGKGYSLKPNFGVYAVLAVWRTYEEALDFSNTLVFRDYNKHSEEHITFYLSPVSTRGSWSGFNQWRLNKPDPEIKIICAITRAKIKFSYLPKFWSMVPDISREHQYATGVLFSKGIGEYPFFEQATFTIWEDKAKMDAFARKNTHQHAINVTRQKQGFSEEMFNRFQPVKIEGSWYGSKIVL